MSAEDSRVKKIRKAIEKDIVKLEKRKKLKIGGKKNEGALERQRAKKAEKERLRRAAGGRAKGK